MFESELHNSLVKSDPVDGSKRPVQVVRGQAGLFCGAVDIDVFRMVLLNVNERHLDSPK
jgi:hypothetical protein